MLNDKEVTASAEKLMFCSEKKIVKLEGQNRLMLPYGVLMIQNKCNVPSLVHYIMSKLEQDNILARVHKE